jgi:hypothetical protein
MVGGTAAWDRARAMIEETYDGICSVYVYGSTVDPETHITHKGETLIYEDIPCRISFKNNNLNDSQPTETAAKPVQKIKLLTSPDANIPKGSKIKVTQNNVTRTYKSSGEPMMYYTHQEIILEIFDKWT